MDVLNENMRYCDDAPKIYNKFYIKKDNNININENNDNLNDFD